MKKKDFYTIIVVCLTICFVVITWLPAITLYVREFFLDKSCAEQGGNFDYATQLCDQAPHDYISFQSRHPVLFDQLSGISVLIGLFGITLLLMKRKRKDRDDYLDKMEEVE